MTRREKGLWDKVRAALIARYRDGVHLVRVENVVGEGTPDVNYSFVDGAEGWIELKEIDGWPKRVDTIVRVDHYTTEQRVWHRRRARAGGRVWVLLRVNETGEIFLMRGEEAAIHLGFTTQSALRKTAGILLIEPGGAWESACKLLNS